jgi:hypothetical protein
MSSTGDNYLIQMNSKNKTMVEMNVETSFEEIQEVLSDGYSMMMLEAFLIAMDSQKKTSGSILNPCKASDNLISEVYKILWSKVIDERMLRSHGNENQTTDFAAMFISLILISSLDKVQSLINYNKVCFETSVLGTGIDFWLSKSDDPLNFAARIEVSGIRKAEPTNNIHIRRKLKEEQVTKSDGSGLPAFISIFEFSNVESLIVEK